MWYVAELDEEYIARMDDVLAVYEKPLSVQEPVVCIDEKPVVLHREVRPPALEVNDSAVKILGDETLKTIARELVDTVRRNTTIDWTVRENVRAPTYVSL
jgi:hypothetical protein